jgi:UDP-N-acetylmuramoyl-L-alanyl-D-glutamate--2,6-diaminopimelate ligase
VNQLIQILSLVPHTQIIGSTDICIGDIQFDSRKVGIPEQGVAMYIAQKGTQSDGHRFIDSSIEKGAQVIVCEELPSALYPDITWIVVPNSAEALGYIASAFYDHPSEQLKLVGITGTNGKTTTVTLLHQLFMDLGYPTGLLSTIVNKINNTTIPSTHTTPDALQLNHLLREMVNAGCEYCFMEVSSHAIVQHRITGLHFTGAIFSNITHDHLDFHHTFANYIQAKKTLFDHLPNDSFALTNIDDRNGKVMVQNCKSHIYTYSLLTAADYKGRIIDNSFEGLQASFNNKEVYFKLCGKFNAYNLLAIYGTALLLGVQEEELLVKMSNMEGATGRFQVLKNDQGTIGIVDYAHTPDALKNVLSTIRDITQNSVEVITVVGCGGDRDALKRPIMAETACQFSHKVILTSDNPRSEDPYEILRQMEEGIPVSFKRNVLTIENRKEAIKTGAMIVQPGGVLLIAGKGHETYQEIKGVKHHFDDLEELRINFNL